MSNIRVTGTLLTPVNTPASNVPIKVISKITYGDVIKSSTADYTCTAAGTYDFQLMYGYHDIQIKFGRKFISIGMVGIDDSVPSTVDLDDLVGYQTVPTNSNLAAMQQIQQNIAEEATQVQQNTNTAVASASDAAGSAQAAQNSADAASSSEQSAFSSANAATDSATSATSSAASASDSATSAEASAETASAYMASSIEMSASLINTQNLILTFNPLY